MFFNAAFFLIPGIYINSYVIRLTIMIVVD